MILLAAGGVGLTRAEGAGSAWDVTQVPLPAQTLTVAADTRSSSVAYAGTSRGVYRSTDGARTWESTGLTEDVRAVAVSPLEDGVLYAGVRPPALFVSRDHGDTWRELAALRRVARWRALFSPAEWPPTAYVSAIALSSTDPRRLVVGFEVGGVAASADGGGTWRAGRGAIFDCHSLAAHPHDGLRFYQGGAGLRKATRMSADGGITWSGPRTTDGLSYGWACVGDPAHPDSWLYSASSSPFKAHAPGRAAAALYRVRERTAERVEGGLPQPIADMPYQLLSRDDTVLAGLANGDVWRSDDGGNRWQKLPVNLGRIERALAVLTSS